MTFTAELYRDDEGHEVWAIISNDGRIAQSGIASDHDMGAILKEWNENA